MNAADITPHITIANLFFYSLGDADRAIQQISRCLHSDPENKACKKVYRRIKSHQKVLNKVKAALGTQKYSTAVRLITGVKDEPGVLDEVKEEIKGLKEEGTFPEKVPMDLLAELTETVCDSYTHMGNNKRGAPYCDEALTYNPESIPAILSKAQRLIDSDEFDQAIAELKKAEEFSGGNDQRVQEKLRNAQMLLHRSKQKDYYKVLGVSRDATEREIKKAHRALTRKFHPDKARDIPKEEAEKKMAQINEAYEVLSDPELRARFDRGDDPNDQSGQNPFAQGGGFPFGGHGGGQQFFFQGGFPGGGFPGGGFPGGGFPFGGGAGGGRSGFKWN